MDNNDIPVNTRSLIAVLKQKKDKLRKHLIDTQFERKSSREAIEVVQHGFKESLNEHSSGIQSNLSHYEENVIHSESQKKQDLSLSIKNRLMEKFKTVKDKAKEEVYNKGKTYPLTKFQHKINKDQEILESNIQEKVEMKILNHQKFNIEIPPVDHQIDFCLKSFDVCNEKTKDDQTVDNADALDSWMPYFLMGSSNCEDKQNGISHYFHPSSLSENRTFPNNVNMRDLEKEGFYMAPKAKIKKCNLNKVVNRLIMENDERKKESELNLSSEKWFKEDGKVICLIDALKKSSSCPLSGNEFISTFVKPESQGNQTIGNDNYYELDIDINNINFTHHHLFSKEHVVASILKQQHQLYAHKKEARVLHYLNEKIIILKSTISQLQENFKPNEQSEEDAKKELDKFKNEIRIVRIQRDEELILQRNLLKNILTLWKDIKLVRKNNKCTNTTIKLIIIKEDVDFDDDLKKWEADAKGEFDWLKEDILVKFKTDNCIYFDKLNRWKDQKLKKKLAKRRMTIRKKKFSNEEFLESEVIKDNEILAEEMMMKPIKPTIISDEDIKHKVFKKLEMIRRKPGEPKIVLQLSADETITSIHDCPIEEQIRRNEVERCRLHIKILYNGKVIGKTEKRNLEHDFIVRIGEILNVKVAHWPESLAFEIYEGDQLIATVYSIIPEVNFPPGKLMKHDFGSCIKRKYPHAAVGSGCSLMGEDIKSSINIFLNTSGVLIGCVTWSSNNLFSIKKPPLNRSKVLRDAISTIGLHGLDNIKRLHDWLETCHIDPNDPSNALILQLTKPIGISGLHSQNNSGPFSPFRLEHLLEEFKLSCEEEISNSQRFQMIEMRESQIPGFEHVKVPLYDQEIGEDIFSVHKSGISDHEKLPKGDEIDTYKKKTTKFLEQMNSSIMKRFMLISTRKTYSEIINENNIPNIRILSGWVDFSNFVLTSLNSFLEPKRPLKPVRTLHKNNVSKFVEQEIRVLINVIRAIGVPTRNSFHIDRKLFYPNNSATNSLHDACLNQRGVISSYFNYEQLDEKKDTQTLKINDQKLVHPFVEVSFQQSTISTSVSAGSQPIWNEELSFTFRSSNNDLSAASPHLCDNFIYFNIYDHLGPNGVANQIGKITSKQIEKRWLGCLKIPFSTIYKNEKIDGTFRIQKPPLLLGYARQGLNTDFMEMTQDDNSYLSLLITLDNKIPHNVPTADEFYPMEDEHISIGCEDWINGLKKQFPSRKFVTTVMTFHGTHVLVTRYLKSIQPPTKLLEDISDEDTKLRVLAKYVSFIPNVSGIPLSGLCNVWATSAEFLKLLQGSEMEHAVLLTNYFLNLGIQAWIVTGTALPEGETGYVLVKSNSSNYYLWKATTGERFSCLDNFCSLKDIGCVIGENNIWGNIQSSDRPNQISFNFNDSSKWRPLFTTKNPYPNLISVQPDSLVYLDVDEAKIKNLQERLESDIRKNISLWRKTFITRWNRYCIQIFRKFLNKLKGNCSKELSDFHAKELENDLSSYSVCGFPLNMPHVGIKEILEIIHSTRIYDIESNDVEFAVAVHIDSSPGYVLSVWIYVASLIKIQ